MDDPVEVVFQVVSALEALGIPYAVGGSMASSIHGVGRTTNDADLIADVRLEHVRPLVAALERDFYIEPTAVAEAIARGSSFNVIHFDTAFKVDVFVRGADAFRAAQIARREPQHLEDARLFVISPEDTVLAKLLWYREGGCVSERQWRDSVAVIRVQGAGLDRRYLEDRAQAMGLADLLQRALTEGGDPGGPGSDLGGPRP